ncbi:uncharacterized protein LOC135845714 [Planococcus citri]|uniref:uncharacterized protein LOC135845714 n=1 Tax=Planococcus citri TaxID=170843 RepID=UPI0031F8E1F6
MESPHLNQDRSEDETIETLRAAILFSVNSTPRNENIDYILQGVRNSGANTEFKTAVAGTLHFFMSYHFHVAIDATLFTIAHHQTCQLPNGWDGEKIILSPLPEIQCAEYLTRFMDQTFKLSLVRTGDLINVNLQHIANGSVFTSDPLDVALVNGFYNENMQLQYAYASIFFHALKHGFQEAIDKALRNESPDGSRGGFYLPVGH